MQLRWTDEAATDLERIADYLLEHAPDRAQNLIGRVYDAPTTLLTSREGTRELVLAPLRYVVVCAVRGDVVFVVRIPHGAQQWR